MMLPALQVFATPFLGAVRNPDSHHGQQGRKGFTHTPQRVLSFEEEFFIPFIPFIPVSFLRNQVSRKGRNGRQGKALHR